jgi:hypothetical protein
MADEDNSNADCNAQLQSLAEESRRAIENIRQEADALRNVLSLSALKESLPQDAAIRVPAR